MKETLRTADRIFSSGVREAWEGLRDGLGIFLGSGEKVVKEAKKNSPAFLIRQTVREARLKMRKYGTAEPVILPRRGYLRWFATFMNH